MAVSSEYGANPFYFGHADYQENLKRGLSDIQIKQYLDQNRNRLRDRNTPGSGGLYDQITGNLKDYAKNTLTGYYQQYLGRDPDPSGLSHYQNRFSSGQATLQQIASDIGGSEESKKYAKNTLTDYYQQYLGRAPDPSGLRFYQDRFSSGRATLPQIASEIQGSTEAQNYRQKKADAKILEQLTAQNEALVASQRAEMAQRLELFNRQQEQVKADAARQARQMQIAQAMGQQDVADVRPSRSKAARKKLTTAGTSGYFGRKGMRIGNVNVADVGGNVTGGRPLTSRFNDPGSFA